jgi:hypothetical protein
MIWWTDLPQGHYAWPIYADDADELGVPIGYQTFRRTDIGIRRGAAHPLAGVDLATVAANMLNLDEIGHLIAADPERARQEFSRFTGRCYVCGRLLTDPDSKVRGIGPDCWRALGRDGGGS